MPLKSIARASVPVLAITIAVTFTPAPAQAEEVVQIGGGRAILNLPAGRPSVGLILLPGGDGDIGIGDDGSIDRQGNWIVGHAAHIAERAWPRCCWTRALTSARR